MRSSDNIRRMSAGSRLAFIAESLGCVEGTMKSGCFTDEDFLTVLFREIKTL